MAVCGGGGCYGNHVYEMGKPCCYLLVVYNRARQMGLG